MHLTTLFRLIFLCTLAIVWQVQEGWSQSAELSAARLRRAPTTVKIAGHPMQLSADLWYDQMPRIGNAEPKRLLGQLTLSTSRSRFPRLSLRRVWIVYGEKVWRCRTEPQPAAPTDTQRQFRLTSAPTIDEVPAGSTVFVAARLFYRNRVYLIRTPEQTIQTVY